MKQYKKPCRNSTRILRGKKIACFGTSSNPPHVGHLIITNQILEFTDTDEVWLIVCWKHSFGKKLWPWKHRWNMAKLMERPHIKACDIEIKRKGISYTLDTVLELREKYPDFEFSWIVGSDLIYHGEYKKWGWWRKLSKIIKFWVMPRPGYPLKKRGLPKCFKIVESKCLVTIDLSSTIIRERLKRGLSIEGLVTPEIDQYIKKHKLK